MSSKKADTAIDNTYREMVTTPLVRPVLRVAVAGSRCIVSADKDAIKNQLKNVYQIIDQINKTIPQSQQASNLYSDPNVKVRLLSSLAEGADRLAVSPELLGFDYELAAVLPFSQSLYCRDFLPEKSVAGDEEGSVVDKDRGTVGEFITLINKIVSAVSEEKDAPIIELDGDHSTALTRQKAYKQCSDVLVNHCDILIAIYNGDDVKDAGTAATVNAAKKQRVPILMISDENPDDMHLVCYQNPHFEPDKKPISSSAILTQYLEEEINNILLFSRFFEQMDKKDDEDKKSEVSKPSKRLNLISSIFDKKEKEKKVRVR